MPTSEHDHLTRAATSWVVLKNDRERSIHTGIPTQCHMLETVRYVPTDPHFKTRLKELFQCDPGVRASVEDPVPQRIGLLKHNKDEVGLPRRILLRLDASSVVPPKEAFVLTFPSFDLLQRRPDAHFELPNVEAERQLRRATACGSKAAAGSTVRSSDLLCVPSTALRQPDCLGL